MTRQISVSIDPKPGGKRGGLERSEDYYSSIIYCEVYVRTGSISWGRVVSSPRMT